jgi:hypothetical protein
MRNIRRLYHWFCCLITLFLLILFAGTTGIGHAGGEEKAKWNGVDEAVIEAIAREHGREARPSLIDKDQGDILLFMFLLAGSAGGFVAGYYWRVLVSEKTKQVGRDKPEKRDALK